MSISSPRLFICNSRQEAGALQFGLNFFFTFIFANNAKDICMEVFLAFLLPFLEFTGINAYLYSTKGNINKQPTYLYRVVSRVQRGYGNGCVSSTMI